MIWYYGIIIVQVFYGDYLYYNSILIFSIAANNQNSTANYWEENNLCNLIAVFNGNNS